MLCRGFTLVVNFPAHPQNDAVKLNQKILKNDVFLNQIIRCNIYMHDYSSIKNLVNVEIIMMLLDGHFGKQNMLKKKVF